MSNKHKDYTSYSSHTKVEVTPAVVEETPVVEVATSEEPIEVLTPNTPDEAVYGIVEGCKMLNVRSAGHANAQIISVIPSGTIVRIIEEESTDEFYGVYVENDNVDFDGFCMKKFIRLV